jgi:hypothetical protein
MSDLIFLVELEMALLGNDVDLGAGRLLPFGNAGIKRFILLAADQLGVDRHAFEFTRQIGGNRATRQAKQDRASGRARNQIPHLLLPETRRSPFDRSRTEATIDKASFIYKDYFHQSVKRENYLGRSPSNYRLLHI